MKIKVCVDESYQDVEIIIRCPQHDETIQKIVEQLDFKPNKIICKKEKQIYSFQISEIYYIESIDEKSFVYTQNDVYESQDKLYMLEEKLKDDGILRISKSCLLNLDALESVRALLNGKYEATLINGEKLIISRNYMKDFKKAFGL